MPDFVDFSVRTTADDAQIIEFLSNEFVNEELLFKDKVIGF